MRRITAILTVLLQGCSFAFVSGPPANHAQLPVVDCSTSNVAPVLDTVLAALGALDLIVATKDNDDQWRGVYCNNSTDPNCMAPLSRGAAIPLYIALTAVGAAGAYYGYTRVGQCKDAKAQLMQRQLAQPPMQGTWPPPAPGVVPAPPAPPAPPADAPPPAPAQP